MPTLTDQTDRRVVGHRQLVNRLVGQRQRVQETASQEAVELTVCQDRLRSVMEAQSIVQGIAQALQQRAHDRIARVVTQCLTAVFDDPYEFQIRFDCKRGKTEARLIFLRDGMVLEDPLNEIGGGVIDVAALALRLSCILLSKPRVRRLVVLDEPFSCIRGDENRARTRTMLQRLSEELGFQVILNTDIAAFQMGTVIELPQ